MTDQFDEHDETIDRIAAALRPLPEVDPSAKARLLVAVAAEREQARERGRSHFGRRTRWAAAIVGLAAAAAFATLALHRNDAATASGVAANPVALPSETAPVAASSPAPEAGATLAASADAGALQPVQLVLRAGNAHRVSVVGDFTEWDAGRAPMTRDPASGLWSITLALRPGRHVYAFLVDDSVWVRDPRAPVAADADFGRPGSVLLVGHP